MKKLFLNLIIVMLALFVTIGIVILAVLLYEQKPISKIINEQKNEEKRKQNISEYDDIIEEASEKYDVPKGLIYAVIECESSFNPKVTSRVGARGLMQIMPSTFAHIQSMMKTSYDDDDLYDPKVNITAGACYLAYLYRYYEDWDLVVAAYNAGMGNVDKWLKNDEYSKDGVLVYIPFKETSAYVDKVAAAWEKYNELI